MCANFSVGILKNQSIQNYEILKEVGQGATTTIYAAICKRGRLRNRKIALKKVGTHRTMCSNAPIFYRLS
jgi:hypothetical protein